MEQKKKSGFGNTVAYVKRHWQLYVFFLLPALLLTLIFKYIPMESRMSFSSSTTKIFLLIFSPFQILRLF